MFDTSDTPFIMEKQWLYLFLQEFSKAKESTLHVILNAHTAFLLCGAALNM